MPDSCSLYANSSIQPHRPFLPFVPALSGLSVAGKNPARAPLTPSAEECAALWDRYAMPPHIQEHCKSVAMVLGELADLALDRGISLDKPLALAGALLHDLAKIYTIQHRGDHAQLGAAAVLRETRNFKIAQMIYHHVWWPWPVDIYNGDFLPTMLLLYADKRIMHDSLVGIEERFQDLLVRYGHTEKNRAHIRQSFQQGLQVETALSERLKVNIHEYTFNCGRLVQRA